MSTNTEEPTTAMSKLLSAWNRPGSVFTSFPPEITPEELTIEIEKMNKKIRLLEKDPFEIPIDRELTAEESKNLAESQKTLLHGYIDLSLILQNHHTNARDETDLKPSTLRSRLLSYGINRYIHAKNDYRKQIRPFLDVAQPAVEFLYEMNPLFMDTWLEMLAALAHYRSTVPLNEQEHEFWKAKARHWYYQRIDRDPRLGPLYYCLAAIAPDNMQKFFYFSLSLSIGGLVDAYRGILKLTDKAKDLHPCDAAFIRVYCILFLDRKSDQLQSSISSFVESVNPRIDELSEGWLHTGYYIATSLLSQLVRKGTTEKTTKDTFSFIAEICTMILQRKKDTHILPFFHVFIAFLSVMRKIPRIRKTGSLEFMPWQLIADILNELTTKPKMTDRGFPGQLKQPWHTLPEDYPLRAFFRDNYRLDMSRHTREELQQKPAPCCLEARCKRILWWWAPKLHPWIEWNAEKRCWDVGDPSTGL